MDEIIFKFIHNSEIGWMLPYIAATGKRVEILLVVIVGFSQGKVAHEHIYWDQASVLVQVGLLEEDVCYTGQEKITNYGDIITLNSPAKGNVASNQLYKFQYNFSGGDTFAIMDCDDSFEAAP